MKIIQSIKPYLQLTAFFLFIWVIFGFTLFFLNPKENKNQFAIPSEAEQVIRIDLKSIFELGSQTLLDDSAKDPILKRLMQQIQKTNLKQTKNKNIGIDLLSDLYIYTIPYNESELICLSFNVINPIQFKKNIKTYLNEKQTFLIKDGVGTIIFSKNQSEKIDLQAIQTYISKLKKNNNKYKTSENHQISFTSKTKKKEQNIDLKISKNALQISGDFHNNEPNNKGTSSFLIPKGFHLSTTQIPTAIKDSIQCILSKNNLNLPRINAFSLNYQKLKIESTAKGFLTEPILEFILDFDSTVNVNELFSNEILLSKIKASKEGNRINIGGQMYFLRQINDHTLYLGTNQSPQIYHSDKLIFKSSGSLSALTEVDGDIWVRSMVQLIPEYKASKNLFSTIKLLNIEANQNTPSLSTVKGNLKMKDNRFLATEVLRFLLDLGVLD
jgi:hypothetical protein